MSGTGLENQIKGLNSRIAELALIVSLKTKEMDMIEKRYTSRLNVLNDYIKQLHSILEITTREGNIEDTMLVERLKASGFTESNDDKEKDNNKDKDNDDNDQTIDQSEYILLPLKEIKTTLLSHKGKSEIRIPELEKPISLLDIKQKEMNVSRRKKMTCSYCNERGHKRSVCPKILYQEI